MIVEKKAKYVSVKVIYDPYIIKRLKKIGNYYWCRSEKEWRYPHYKYNDLLKLKNELFDPDIRVNDRVKKLEKHMLRKGYSKRSISAYVGHFQRYLDYSYNHLDVTAVNEYINMMLGIEEYSHSYVNQFVSAIKVYARLTNEIKVDELVSIDRPKSIKKLPKTMSIQQLEAVFNVTDNLKHQTALMIAYSAGLRVSEVANLKLEDVDSDRMLIRIKQAKGSKDRLVPLSAKMLTQLRKYYKLYEPKYWLFENMVGDHLSTRTFQKVFEKSKIKAKIKDYVTFHSLRHSYATHLLEAGVNLRYIQEILGHQSSKTTEVYTHVCVRHYSKIINPLETINVKFADKPKKPKNNR